MCGRMTPVIGTILRVLCRLVVAAAIGFLVFVGVGPHTGRYQVLTVLSGSMRPTAPPGSMVVVVPVPLEQVRVGDVITFQPPGEDHRVVTHRVIEVLNPGPRPSVRTRGDANATADPWTATLSGDRVYTMRAAIPHLGTLVRVLRRPGPHFLGAVVSPVALAGVWLTMIWRRRPADENARRSGDLDAVAV